MVKLRLLNRASFLLSLRTSTFRQSLSEDLAHLASSAVKLGILHEEDFNAALAAAGLQYVGQFSSSQLALFSSSLARLPSTGRAAFLGVAALQAAKDAKHVQ